MEKEYLEQFKKERQILNEVYYNVYANTLTEYIKALDDDTLLWLYGRFGANDITGNAIPIYEVISIEMQYRQSSKNKTK